MLKKNTLFCTFDCRRIKTYFLGQVPNRRSKSPGIRFEANVSAHEQVVKNRRSKTVDLGKNEDSSLVLGSAVDSQTYVISEKSKKTCCFVFFIRTRL